MGDKVSVIIPVFQVERYIRQCAESLRTQTYDHLEFVFVNDGSTDHSMDILMEILEADPSFKSKSKIINLDHQGLPAARMAGIAATTGDWIIHVDSDDWVEPDYIKLLAEAAKEEGADVAYCDFIKEYDTRKVSKIDRENDFFPSDGHEALKALHNSRIRAYMWNKLIHRSLYDAVKLFPPICGYHEDIVFQTQLLYNAKKCVHVHQALYHYRKFRKGALTSVGLIKARRQSAANMLSLYDALPEKDSPKEVVGIDLLWRGGWYCAIIMAWKMLSSHKEAVEALLAADYKRDYRVSLGKQVYTKLICRLIHLTQKRRSK